MKNVLIIALMIITSITASAQKFGIRGGLSSTDFNPKDLVVMNSNDVDQLKLAVDEAKYGLHFGLFAQFRKNKFFIQPEVIFNSNKIEYTVEDIENNVGATAVSARYNYVDVPINAGLKLGPLRIQAGPVGHFFVNSASDLKNWNGYKEKFKDATWGVQYGFGLDIWRTVLDFKWERNFKDFGDHVTFNDISYNFDDTQDRFIVSLGIAF